MQTESPHKTRSLSYHVIFNPVSGPDQPGESLTQLESALEDLPHLQVHLTKPELDAETLTRQALDSGADVVIAAGGDGTVTGVASALLGTDRCLGIIPAGTANGFATALDIPENIREACEVIKAGHRRTVDTSCCNGQLMLLVACIGFEANMLTHMDREEKSRLGKFAIVINSLKELRDVEQFDVELKTPEHTWREPATAVTIANSASLDMVLAQGPDTVAVDDGKLSVTVVTPEHRWGILTSATKLFLSALRQEPAHAETVKACKVKKVTVKTEPPQKIFIDGEPAGETPLTAECHPQSLTVLAPGD